MTFNCGNVELCMVKNLSAVGCGEDVEGEKAEMERLRRKLNKQKVKVGRERWGEKGKDLRSEQRCLDRRCREVLDAFNPISEVESVGFSWVFVVCA